MPDDTSPHGGEALHPLPDRATIPLPKPAARDETARDRVSPSRRPPDPSARPTLPDHPQRMPADNRHDDRMPAAQEPGKNDTGRNSVTQQPGN